MLFSSFRSFSQFEQNDIKFIIKMRDSFESKKYVKKNIIPVTNKTGTFLLSQTPVTVKYLWEVFSYGLF